MNKLQSPTFSDTWKAVVGFEIYEVSNQGQCRCSVGTPGHPAGLRTGGKALNGYFYVTFGVGQCGGGRRTRARLLHRLVAEAFIPNPGNLPQVNHKNGIKSDNRSANLEWVTPGQNLMHACRVLKRRIGVGHCQAKLCDDSVRQIRKLLALGKSYCAIGRIFGVSHGSVRQIHLGTSWRHVSDLESEATQ